MWDQLVLYQYLCGTTLYCTVYLISTFVGPLCIATVGIYLISRPTYMWDHFVLHCDCLSHQYLCGTTLYCTVYLTSTYVGRLCIATVCIYLISRPTYMWDHFVLHCDCLPHQYLCGTTLYCTVYLTSTYVGPLCIATVGIYLISRPTYMWDHFVLHCDCLPHQYLCGTTLYCTVYLTSTYVGPLCIATVGIYLISRPTYMRDHFVLHCDCLPHQYLCWTTLYCTSTYVGPLCIALFTSPVPMWVYLTLCGTTWYCSTYVGLLCIALFTSSVHMWDHFVLQQ